MFKQSLFSTYCNIVIIIVNIVDALAVELVEAGIMTEANKLESGIWTGNIETTCIFNHNETPQFVNYGVDGTPSGLVFAGKGETCSQLLHENRECITIHPFVSFSGIISSLI